MPPEKAPRPRDEIGRFTSKEVETSKKFPKKTVVGIAAVTLVGVLGYANRDQIGNSLDNNDGSKNTALGQETTTTTSTLPDTTTTSEAPKLNLYALFAQDIVT